MLAVCVLGVLGLRTFVCDLFRVNSSSMAPSIWPGELVLVSYDRSRPERLEPIVVDHEDEFVTKRAVGIGGVAGETILIESTGDVRIDGRYMSPEVLRTRILLFDQDLHPVDEHFARGSSGGDPWREEGDVLVLDASGIARGHEAGLLRYHTRLRDHYLARDGSLVEGLGSVSDAAVEFDVRLVGDEGVIRVGLVEGGDTFWLEIELAGESARVALLRHPPAPVRGDPREVRSGAADVLAEASTALRLGDWVRVALDNIDNHITASYGDVDLAVSYERNGPSLGLGMGNRVKLGGEGCVIEVRSLRVWRDMHYTARGRYAVGMRYSLESGKLFLLGDNSASSRDSREYGPVDEDQLIGRPVMVVWPPSAIRWLR